MRKKEEQPISMKFLFALFLTIVLFAWYFSIPNDIKKIKKSKTFEEMLEYSDKNSIPETEDKEVIVHRSSNDINTNPSASNLLPPKSFPQEIQDNNTAGNSSSGDFNKLLDILADYPTKNQQQIQLIVNKILAFKGYPENLVAVNAGDIDQSRAKTHDSYLVANFDFITGKMNVSNKMLYELDNKTMIAIIAHELDHFDKLANLCKSIGLEKFSGLFEKNNIKGLNTNFWEQASSRASDKNFDTKLYQDGLTRLITQSELEMTSSYSDFYKLAENIRNPLEVSAYKVSDDVYNYYKIKIEEGPIRILSKKFNDIDWALHDLIQNSKGIENQRIAIFDYFFAQAILSKLPQFYKEYNTCVNTKNGDLTAFWLAYEGSVKSFYQHGSMTKNAYDTVNMLLDETLNKIKKGITQKEILQAYKFKINTLLSNLVYPNAVKNLRGVVSDYFRYIKNNKLDLPEDELQCALILICIDNDLNTKNTNKEVALYYLNMPPELADVYSIKGKRNRFGFLYNNKAFQSKKGASGNEEKTLIDLINKSRLNIRISG